MLGMACAGSLAVASLVTAQFAVARPYRAAPQSPQSPQSPNLVVNGGFETVAADTIKGVQEAGPLRGVRGWRSLPRTISRFVTHVSTDVFTPGQYSNAMGEQTAFEGLNYGGVSAGHFVGEFLTEAMGGTLSKPAQQGKTYDVQFALSLGDSRSSAGTRPFAMDFFFNNRATGRHLKVGTWTCTSITGWQVFAGRVTIPAKAGTYDEIIFLGGSRTKDWKMSYAYIDDVQVRQVDPRSKRVQYPKPVNHAPPVKPAKPAKAPIKVPVPAPGETPMPEPQVTPEPYEAPEPYETPEPQATPEPTPTDSSSLYN